MSESPDDIPACLQCGTCCFSKLEAYVQMTGADHDRLGERAKELTHFVGNRLYMRMVDGRCAALLIDRDAGQFVCTVYERRPAICRELERGSPQCLGEFVSKGERPPAALRRARAAASKPE